MSEWKAAKPVLLGTLSNRGVGNASLTYTYFLPDDFRAVMRLLLSHEKGQYSVRDFYDFARFTEDFVLCDNIGGPDHFADYLGPYLLEHFADPTEIPIFDIKDQIDLAARESSRPDEAALGITRLQATFGPLVAATSLYDIANPTRPQVLWSRLEILSQISQPSHADQLRMDLIRRILENTNVDIVRLRQLRDQALLRLGLHQPVSSDLIPNYARALEAWSRSHGVCISPGYSMREYILTEKPDASLTRRLYEETDSVHRELLTLLADWTQPQLVHVPPVLSILLQRAKCREELLPHLVMLRREFAPLREAMRKTTAALSGDLKLKEKLRIVQSLQSARETILKEAAPLGGKSIIQRTWDIVKKGHVWDIVTGLADVVIDWDASRRLVGGIRHFVHLERDALATHIRACDIERHFGQLKST